MTGRSPKPEIAHEIDVPTHEVPLFPLHCVLFPGGPLPLKIFEPRYVDMVGRCLKANEPFGVVAIRRGSEVGPADMFAIGTLANIVDWYREQTGLLGIETAGGSRFRIAGTKRREDGLYVGEIELLPTEPRVPLPAHHGLVAAFLRRLLPETGARYHGAERDYADASWVGFRLAEILPLPLSSKQEMLEIEDPVERIERLAPIVTRIEARDSGSSG